MENPQPVRQCEVCGHMGGDVQEHPFYDKVLGRDSTRYECDDIEACLDRKLVARKPSRFYDEVREAVNKGD